MVRNEETVGDYSIGDVIAVQFDENFEGEVIGFGFNKHNEDCAIIAIDDVPTEQVEEDDIILEGINGKKGILYAFTFLGNVNRSIWTCPSCEQRLSDKDRVDYLCRDCRGW